MLISGPLSGWVFCSLVSVALCASQCGGCGLHAIAIEGSREELVSRYWDLILENRDVLEVVWR